MSETIFEANETYLVTPETVRNLVRERDHFRRLACGQVSEIRMSALEAAMKAHCHSPSLSDDRDHLARAGRITEAGEAIARWLETGER